MFIQANGANVYYEQHGEGRPDILLLHGWGCQISLWQPVIDQLSKRARVTALDFPGHGKSGRPPEPWDTKAFSDMAAEMIRALELEDCVVIGHSHGGRVGLLLAADYPQLVRKLILTGAAGLRGEPTQAQKRRSEAYQRLRRLSDALEKARVFGSIPEQLRDALRKRYGSPDYNALDAEMRRTFVKVVNADLTDRLPDIKAPTLLLWGSEDTETPLWMGKKMEENIPDAGLVLLQGGSHYAYLEKVDQFLRIAAQFIFGGTL